MKLIAYTDGGSRGNPGNAAIGGVIFNEKNETLFEISKYIGIATNNEAEYQAVIAVLDWVEQSEDIQIDEIHFRLDSKLVVEQVSRRWKIKELRMRSYAEHIWQQIERLQLQNITFTHIPREENKLADALVNVALDAQAV